jgi:zinc protease
MKTNSVELPVIPAGVKLHTLSNGLTVIIREDRSAPVVSAQAWCKTGSIHEGEWIGAGLSHVLEHMLFKGTTTRPGSRIDQEIQEAGGYMNAYTSFDRTVYWINVPNTGAHTAIDILCDIMQNAALPADELAKELDVIRREMDMNQDDPHRRASRRLFETAYTRSPYRFTVIGYPDVFNQLQSENITNYYRNKYVPNNMFFVVVGDIEEATVLEQIKAAFADKKTRPMTPTVLPEEPKQTAPREVMEEAPIELTHFHFSWHIPDLRHPDVPVLDVLATLLGNGRSSRLFQRVREKGLVTSADAWTYNPGAPGLFGMSASAEAEQFQPARTAMLDEIERLKTDLVPAEELSKVIKQFIAGTLSSRKTMQGQAQDLGGGWLAADDLNFSERYLNAVKRVTSSDIQRVAREYLTPENRTLYALAPVGTLAKHNGHVERIEKTAVQKFDFPNGLRLLVKEDHRLPFVEYRAVFKGGVIFESAANNGITQLLSRMLLKGTQKRSAEQIVTEIESLGGTIDTFGGNNSFGATAELLSSDFEIGLTLLADVILNPTFPAEALEREQQIQTANIRAQRDQMLQSGARAMRRRLFGESAYGLDAIGVEESVNRITVSDLQAFHQQVFGDVDVEQVKAAAERLFGKWQKNPATPGVPRFDSSLQGIQRVSETRDKKQAVLLIGFRGVSLHSPDRYALELLQEACSDLGSRLFLRIREQLGLAYYVGAQHFMGLVPGYFAFYCGTAPEQVELVEAEFLKEVSLLRKDGLTTEELKRSKAKIVGQKKISRQDLGTYASTAALDELYGLGHNFAEEEDAKIEAVTLEDVRAAAQKYLTPEQLVIASVVPGANAENK